MSKKPKNKLHREKEVVKNQQNSDHSNYFIHFIEKLNPFQFNLLSVLIIIIAGYLSYSNSFNGEMIFDDINIIQQNDQIKDLGNYSNFSEWLNPNGRPLAMFSFALNYSFDEYNVFGYHLLNFIIHLIFGCFVFLFARMILSIKAFDNNPVRRFSGIIALFIALVCVVHPIQTQAVSYIVQRMAAMAAMFYLMCIYFYGLARIKYAKDGLNISVVLYYLLSAISALLGLYSKQTIVTIPFAILLFELFFVRKKDGRIFKKYLIVSGSLLITISIIVILGGFLPIETETISRSEYLYTQFRVIIKYIQLLILPVHQALDYNFSISSGFGEGKVLISLFVIILILAAGILLYRTKHLVSFGIFWFFITLSVESSIIPIRDVLFEHRLYLPIFGFSLAIVSIIFDLLGNKRIITAILFFLALNIIYGFATFERNKVWHSKLSLWLDNTIKKPGNARAYSNLGSTYITLLDFEKAEKSYSEAVRLDSSYTEALFNLGNVKIDLGKFDESIKVFNTLINLDTTFYNAYYGRGVAYQSLHLYEQALSDFKHSISLKDIEHNTSVYNKCGLGKLALRDFSGAIEEFNNAIESDSVFVEAYNNKGLVFLEMKEYDTAIDQFSKALKINPSFFESYNNRGNAFFRKNQYEEALHDYMKAVEIMPNDLTVLKNIAVINYYLKNYPAAIEFYNRILSITPQNPQIINDRGIIYYLRQEYEKAYDDLVKARQMGIITNPEVFDFLKQYMRSKGQ